VPGASKSADFFIAIADIAEKVPIFLKKYRFYLEISYNVYIFTSE